MARMRLGEALLGWWREDAVERVARWRGAPDARPEEAVLERHAILRSERALDTLREAIAQGRLEDDLAVAARAWVGAARAAPHQRLARARRESVLQARVPFDSDHFPAHVLLSRALVEPREAERRKLAQTLEALAGGVWADARRAAEAHLDEGREDAAAAHPPEPPTVDAARAQAFLTQTADAYQELIERLSHRAKRRPPEQWQELLWLLRGATPDGVFTPHSRVRRLGDALHELGFRDALAERVSVEPSSPRAIEHDVVAIAIPGDVRLRGGAMLGLESELDGARAVGRALAIALTHPALPALAARPRRGSIGWLFGALLSGLYERRAFLRRAVGQDEREARATIEHALVLRLARLRSRCVAALESGDPAAGLHEALAIEAPRAVATTLLEPPDPVALEAELSASALSDALRERFDEDWWRNPRAAAPLRGAAERGERVDARALLAELNAPEGDEGARVSERLTGR